MKQTHSNIRCLKLFVNEVANKMLHKRLNEINEPDSPDQEISCFHNRVLELSLNGPWGKMDETIENKWCSTPMLILEKTNDGGFVTKVNIQRYNSMYAVLDFLLFYPPSKCAIEWCMEVNVSEFGGKKRVWEKVKPKQNSERERV